MAKNVKILLEVNTGTDVAPVWTPVGGQRNANLSESVEELDLTTEDSEGAQEFEAGLYSAEITCDGLYVPTATGYTALKTAFRNKEKIKARLQEDGQPTEMANCIITSMETDAPYDGESTYSATLRVTGKIESV
ncbi:phage tail tube protein [Mesobacillus foraminis]|uniref:TP901-1 family phage major tail protein n=1 Tax=Mesobacillus foraminis TaxID=279826 RepID=A0A4R2BG49_9BACI|nr:phage tail tube protein [Mesobacillus foraminis]TCN25483.1 TP901-1 family phage major tail protein [Mesobacillus foraminis]